MCLVLSWKTRLETIRRTSCLSQDSGIGVAAEKPNF